MSKLQSELAKPRTSLAVLETPGAPDADLRRRVLEALLAPPRPRKMTYEEFLMKLADSGREPDLIFIAREHLDRLAKPRTSQPTYLDGPADLAIEIISPESIGRDRGDKFYEYERAGIPEFWLNLI